MFCQNLGFSTPVILQSFFVIFPLEQVTPLSLWLGVRSTPEV